MPNATWDLPEAFASDWEEAIDDFLNRKIAKYSGKTHMDYGYMLRYIARWATKEGIAFWKFERKHLDRFLAAYHKAGGGKRAQELIAIRFRIFVRDCVEAGTLTQNYLQGYKIQRAPKPQVKKPSAQDLHKLLKAAEQRQDQRTNRKMRGINARRRRFFRTRDYALLMGIMDTGCRIGELLRLEIADFDAAQKQIFVRKTKTGKPRTIPISDAWIKAVEDYQKVRPDVPGQDALFLTQNGEPMSGATVWKLKERLEQDCEVTHLTLHSIRHYVACELARVNLYSASKVLGHDNIATTQLYLHDDPDAVRQDKERAGLLNKVLEQSSAPVASGTKRRRVI